MFVNCWVQFLEHNKCVYKWSLLLVVLYYKQTPVENREPWWRTQEGLQLWMSHYSVNGNTGSQEIFDKTIVCAKIPSEESGKSLGVDWDLSMDSLKFWNSAEDGIAGKIRSWKSILYSECTWHHRSAPLVPGACLRPTALLRTLEHIHPSGSLSQRMGHPFTSLIQV